MRRLILACALCVAAASMAALDTPLTLVRGGKTLIIDPVGGSITEFQVTDSGATRLGLGKPVANFVDDVQFLLKRVIDVRDGVPFQTLRVGTMTNKPTYGDMFNGDKWFGPPTRADLAAGKPVPEIRASRAEDAFWKGEPSYDGTVRAAVSTSGYYLCLVLPSLHTLMIYRLDGELVTLVAFRNYGPELMMPGYNTDPDPKAMANEFLRELPADRQKAAKKALGLDDDPVTKKEAKDAKAGGQAGDEPATPKSDVWVCASGGQDSFLVVDVLNDRALMYMIGKGVTLTSVRDLSIDLVMPGLVGGALRSDPSGDRLFTQFMSSRKALLTANGLPTDPDEIRLLLDEQRPTGKSKGGGPAFDAAIDNGIATLNFIDKKTFICLNTKNGEKISLTAARDYTLDQSIALLDQLIMSRTKARESLGEAIQLGNGKRLKEALLNLRLALSLDPRLYKDAEAKLKNAFKGDPQAEFQAVIDEAAKKADEMAKQDAARKKALEELRAKRKAGG